ncbi:HU-CCDC81 and SPOR domain-containing protein [Macrococcus carouselicus]|uniref:CD-NTase-associated protein 16 NUDIX domain-containing protein n=1 Tax=Macrococcus carouselicus TaxID=69969 RepID=A0A9Q8CK97_9STAP|nr:HU-CCDC81 and SPOR domain-containing protein [Macrococcus carouselicus]TDL95532.1 hypothetical protein ERX40_10135 [Macrococcus carouselicus]
MKKYSYRKKLMKTVGLLTIWLISVWFIYYTNEREMSFGEAMANLIAGSIISYLVASISQLTDNTSWKSSQSTLKKNGEINDDSAIRISFAYLFRIKIDGHYFLVPNSRSGKYQPVGGAYKFYKKEAEYMAYHFSAENDNRIAVDEVTKMDYRLLVKSRDLKKFIRRFDKTSYREDVSDLSREFVEEIFSTGILDRETFGDLTYRFVGRHMTDVEYGRTFSHYELLLADIIEVRLTDRQEELFRDLMRQKSDKYLFASADEINSLGVNYVTQELDDNIANHTPKILSENTDDLIMRNRHQSSVTVRL